MKVIQIGANNGKDSTFEFISQNKDALELVILVEPIPFIIDNLKSQYKHLNNIVVENIAIHSEDVQSMTLYYLEGTNYQVSSFSKKHVIDHNPPHRNWPMASMEVPCYTINDLINKYDLEIIDHLFIDTEGLDVHILGSIDFEKYTIKNIIFEASHTDGSHTKGENFHQITNYLNQLGYDLSWVDQANIKATLK